MVTEHDIFTSRCDLVKRSNLFTEILKESPVSTHSETGNIFRAVLNISVILQQIFIKLKWLSKGKVVLIDLLFKT